MVRVQFLGTLLACDISPMDVSLFGVRRIDSISSWSIRQLAMMGSEMRRTSINATQPGGTAVLYFDVSWT